MEKFNRVYSLKVEVDDGNSTATDVFGNLEITLPITLEFRISRADFSSAQTGTFKLINLGEHTRNAIQKDFFQFEQLRSIQLRAGYDSPNGRFMPLVFNGTVKTAYSEKSSPTEWTTTIEAFDGGFAGANGFVSFAQSSGIPADETLRKLATLLPNQTGQPIIGSFPTVSKRGEVFCGMLWDYLQAKSAGRAFIDNGQLKALNYDEVIRSPDLPVISAETGLLNSPQRTGSQLVFDMIFEPRLSVGQVVLLDSVTNKRFNREWKVLGFEHAGTISSSESGDCITSARLWFTNDDLKFVAGVPVL